MAYFDSAKNRALWQKELAGLRAEKERRAQYGYVPGTDRDRESAMAAANPHRIRTSYTKLEQEEYQEQRERAQQKQRDREILRERMAARESKQPERSQEHQL
jgi:hypothetical protein